MVGGLVDRLRQASLCLHRGLFVDLAVEPQGLAVDLRGGIAVCLAHDLLCPAHHLLGVRSALANAHACSWCCRSRPQGAVRR
jgi:hypothetical protein